MDCCGSVLVDKEDSLGIKLVNEGYDLWLPNSRGTWFSKDHEQAEEWASDPSSINTYWQFSFQDMAEFDMPVLWDYVLNETGQEKATFIGHNMGAT